MTTEVSTTAGEIASENANGGEHRHLCMVGGVWYVQARVHGKRIKESTFVSDLAQARRIRDARLATAVIEHVTGVCETPSANGRAYSPMQEVIQTYKTAALVEGLPEKTIVCYLSSLKQVVKAAGHDMDTATAAVLNGDTVRAYVKAHPLDTKRARVTARSTLRQARAIFARWTIADRVYADLNLPPLTDFLQVGRVNCKGEVNVYVRRPADLVQKTKSEAEKLPPNLKAVWFLAYGLALRSSEMVAATWDWIGPDGDGRTCLHVLNRDDFTLKGVRPRSVPIPANVLTHLKAVRNGRHLLPGANPSERLRLIEWSNTWMRQVGWSFKEYSKGVHELRKLRGAEWYTQINPAYASEMLGHTSMRTTQTFYACYNRGHDALPC